MTNSSVFLIGAGAMAQTYTKVLSALNVVPTVIGRGATSAKSFEDVTGLSVGTGPLKDQLSQKEIEGATAIVTVNAAALADVSISLMQMGVKRLLVEKPAALDLEEMSALQSTAAAAQAEVFVAYNRRFLSSVIKADEIIVQDGGIVSVRFDFSEPTQRIGALGKPDRELSTWFYGNSTHVIDLALHFFGLPQSLHAHIAGEGGVAWHPQAGVFAGHGHRADGATLAWHSNWISPGRWGVEIYTPESKLILQPLEKLRVQSHASFSETEVPIEDQLDMEFKPGLFRQTRAFLSGQNSDRLVSLNAHALNMTAYEVIRTGGAFERDQK